ncbi:putative IS2 ORF [Klebsiella michiganensis]|nr:putative IS2 ORF [Klebsiella michiganensis]KZT48783.1 hypothetical protein A6A30_05185 [Klebsiella michiganensis]
MWLMKTLLTSRCVNQRGAGHVAEAAFHRSQHYVLYCFTVEAARSDCPVQCLTVTAVQRERDSQFFSVITAELEPVRAPSLIAFFHGHFASMCPFRWRYSGFSLKQQRILAHDPVNTFGIDRRHTIKFGLSAKQRPYPTITIRGQLSDNMVYTEKHIRII